MGLPADVGTAADWFTVRLLSGQGKGRLHVLAYHRPVSQALRSALRMPRVRFPQMRQHPFGRPNQIRPPRLLGS